MPKGKEDVPVEEVSEEITPVEETPTNEQEDLQAKVTEYELKLEAAEAEKKRLDEGYKGLQTKYNKTYEEKQKITDLRSDLDDVKKYIKILAMQQSELGAREDIDEMAPKQRENYLKKFEDMEAETERKRQLATQKAQQDEYNRNALELYTRAEALYGDDIDKLHQVRNLIRANDTDLVEKMLAKAEPKGETVEKKESDEEIYERVAKEKGLLKNDPVVPSGTSSSFEQIEERYAKGEVSNKEYAEARQKSNVH